MARGEVGGGGWWGVGGVGGGYNLRQNYDTECGDERGHNTVTK